MSEETKNERDIRLFEEEARNRLRWRAWQKDVADGVEPSPLTTQVGGGHYKDMAIQPVEYITANNLGFVEGSVIKYVSRWRKKGGVDDLRKARHFIDLLIELETKNAA